MSSANNLELHVSVALPAAAVRDAAMRILKAIGERSAPYDHVTMSLGLRDLQIPIDADVSVPIRVGVEPRPLRWEADVEIAAANNQRFFPRFHGMLTVTPNGHNACELWLQGSYDLPMGLLGTNIDATILRGNAQTSLQRFLEWLSAEIARNVVETEREHEREVRGLH